MTVFGERIDVYHDEMGKFMQNAQEMIHTASILNGKGFLPATGGNISTVLRDEPFLLQISCSGVDKGNLNVASFINVDASGKAVSGNLKPSAETLLHISIIKKYGASSVIHTHSVFGTVLSEIYAENGYVSIEGYEMLKALSGNSTHLMEEKIPVFNNSQDMERLSGDIIKGLEKFINVHGFLLSGHGLYTWGKTVDEARRHAEALEFLFEVKYRTLLLQSANIR